MSFTALRALSTGELIDASIRMARVNFRRFAPASIAIALPVQTVGGLFAVSIDSSNDPLTQFGDGLIVASISLGLSIVGMMLLTVFTAEIAIGSIAGSPTSARLAARAAGRHAGTLGLLIVLMVVGLTLGLLTAAIATIWLGIAWSVTVPVVYVERVGASRALRRSFRLTRGRWWKTLGGYATAAFLGMLLATSLATPVSLLFSGSDGEVTRFVVAWVPLVLTGIVTGPVWVSLVVLTYFDLRVRREGFDLALRFAALEQAGAPRVDARAPGS